MPQTGRGAPQRRERGISRNGFPLPGKDERVPAVGAVPRTTQSRQRPYPGRSSLPGLAPRQPSRHDHPTPRRGLRPSPRPPPDRPAGPGGVQLGAGARDRPHHAEAGVHLAGVPGDARGPGRVRSVRRRDRRPRRRRGLRARDRSDRRRRRRLHRGAVWILFQATDGTVLSTQKISATEGGFGGTLANGDLFGSSIARLGDLNGDGVEDIAVGGARRQHGRREPGGGVDPVPRDGRLRGLRDQARVPVRAASAAPWRTETASARRSPAWTTSTATGTSTSRSARTAATSAGRTAARSGCSSSPRTEP